MSRKAYPSDVSDEAWAFVAPYLTLMREDAPQREHSLRELFNGPRWMVRTAAPWRMMPHDLPPWHSDYNAVMPHSSLAGIPPRAFALANATALG